MVYRGTRVVYRCTRGVYRCTKVVYRCTLEVSTDKLERSIYVLQCPNTSWDWFGIAVQGRLVAHFFSHIEVTAQGTTQKIVMAICPSSKSNFELFSSLFSPLVDKTAFQGWSLWKPDVVDTQMISISLGHLKIWMCHSFRKTPASWPL